MRTLAPPLVCLLLGLAACWHSASTHAQNPPDGTAEALKARVNFTVPAGFELDLWAAEPMLSQPVAFCIDERGRVYTAETYRFNRGTEEYRHRPFFLEGDLQNTTTADRLAMYERFKDRFPGGMAYFSKYSERIRLLEDTKGVGKADKATTFAEGFNAPLDGLAAGVLAKDGDVYFTCIPKLWRLRDTKGTGKADVKQALHDGFGTQTAFLGHDLHGLIFGPDGKLYFSVGDRGYHVKTHEGNVLSGPRRGAVFRCDPDGKNLEVVHVGLRNPQELAFDQYGNLFAADNNCDKGDDSRLVYIVEGGDSGWRMEYQTMETPYQTGPWHAEKLWHLHHEGQPAWIVPPVGKLGAGPGGFVFSSGVGMPERYRNAFFMCNFTSGKVGGIDAFRVVPQGAGFAIKDYHQFLSGMLATDVDFGYDGRMYVSDWVGFQWDGGGVGKGRMWTVRHPASLERDSAPLAVQRVRMRHGFKDLHERELLDHFLHHDMRVRLRAQYELAARGPRVMTMLGETARHWKKGPVALHCVWALAQIARKHPEAYKQLDWQAYTDLDVQVQAIKALGDDPSKSALESLSKLSWRADRRLQYFAVEALGKLQVHAAIPKIMELFWWNGDEDPYLRHACVQALARMNRPDAVLLEQARYTETPQRDPAAQPERASVRLGVLLMLRKLGDRRVVVYLNDPEEKVVVEAARAIHDLPLEGELPALAALSGRHVQQTRQPADALWRRILNANFRLGQPEHAQRVLEVMASNKVNEAMRLEALACLRDWAKPPPRDRVLGSWRPLPPRDDAPVRRLLEEKLPLILADGTGRLPAEVAKVAAQLELKIDDLAIGRMVQDAGRDVEARGACLQLLARRKAPNVVELVRRSLSDAQPRLRIVARELLIDLDPAQALAALRDALKSDVLLERQLAYRGLGKLTDPTAAQLLLEALAQLQAGKLELAVQVDVLAAAKSVPAARARLAEYETARGKLDLLTAHRAALHGGNAARGRQVFQGHTLAQCVRCHKAEGQGGEAGPDLSVWAPKGTREHLLEALLEPSKKITPGYGFVTLALSNGQLLFGVIKEETAQRVLLVAPEGREIRVAVGDIEERLQALSLMPTMHNILSLEEMRDVIEYLASLRP